MILDNEAQRELLNVRDDLTLVAYALELAHSKLEDNEPLTETVRPLEAVRRASEHINAIAQKVEDIARDSIQPQRDNKAETTTKPAPATLAEKD